MIKKKSSGLSLIESLMIIAMVGVIVILMANLPNALNLVNKSRHLGVAREIASKQIEDKRAVDYVNLTTGSIPIIDSRLDTLFNGSGTILIEDCSGDICTNGENIKRITVTISWKEDNKDQTLNLQTLIGEKGLN